LVGHRRLLGFIAGLIEQKDKKILDIGCATGLLYFLLPDHKSHESYGVDVELDFISVFEERFGAGHGKVCNIEYDKLPFGDSEFDLVICNSILEHTLSPNLLISEAYRVLKPGGRAVFAVPNALAFIKRWNFLRGRNVFSPLIDNLLHKSYQKRCAVFYSAKDIKVALGQLFKEIKILFLNKENFYLFFPHLRDTLIAIARK